MLVGKTLPEVAASVHDAENRYPLTPQQQRLIKLYVNKSIDERVRRSCYDGYGQPDSRVLDLLDRVTIRMIDSDMDHVPGQSVSGLAILIKKAVDQVITGLEFKPNPVLSQLLLIQGICSWIRTHLEYDHQWAKFVSTPDYLKLTYAERERHFGPVGILQMARPKCVCAGFANTTTDLARSLGLKCEKANGYQRWGMSFKDGWPTRATHSWNVFDLPDGLRIPSDNSISMLPLERTRALKGRIRHPISLPVSSTEWGIFLMFHYGRDDITPSVPPDKQDQHSLLRFAFEDWKSMNITVMEKYRNAFRMAGT